MKEINISDELFERIKEYQKKSEDFRLADFIVEDAVNSYVDHWPWGHGDICVHNDECMHHKSVAEWEDEQ